MKSAMNIKNKKTFEVFKRIKKTLGPVKNFVPLHNPSITKKDIQNVVKCIKSTFVSSTGRNVLDFEKEIKKITKSKYVISVANGTCGLQLSLKILGVSRKDEILVPSLTFAGTVNSILSLDAIPHFVDSDYETLGVNPKKLEEYLKKNFYLKKNVCFNKKTKNRIRALIVVHVFGHSAKLDEIKRICKRYKILILEDAAECIGSLYKKKHLGTFGNLGVLSFNGNKTITTGGGGAILTNSMKLAKKALHLSGGSKVFHKWEYIHDEPGFNFKLPALNASLGLGQLSSLQIFIKKKRTLYMNYKKNFKDLNFVNVFEEPKNSYSNYWLQTLILNKKNKFLKNKILKITNQKNIMTRPAWKPLHTLKHLKNFPKMNLDICEDLYSRIINIPSSQNLVKKI